jgi:hypothetical protein
MSKFEYLHLICNSRESWEFFNKVGKVLYWCECNGNHGDHHHWHAVWLNTKLISNNALRMQLTRKYGKRENGKKHYEGKPIKTEDHLAGAIHYMSCAKGQTGHQHFNCHGFHGDDFMHDRKTIICQAVKEDIADYFHLTTTAWKWKGGENVKKLWEEKDAKKHVHNRDKSKPIDKMDEHYYIAHIKSLEKKVEKLSNRLGLRY